MSIRDLNESPRPRVLVWVGDDATRNAAVTALNGLANTVKVIDSLEEVSSSEWDAIVTSESLGDKAHPAGRASYLRRLVAEHLKAIVLQDSSRSYGGFEDIVVRDEALKLRVRASSAVGKKAVLADGMSEELSALVKSQLVPVVAAREKQFGVRVTSATGGVPREYPGFQPLLIGPDAIFYAAHYERAPGSSVWLIPDDVPDLSPWFHIAFEDWHRLEPSTFPAAPDWYEDAEWMTPDEQSKADALVAERTEFAKQRRAHELRLSTLQDEFDALRSMSAAKERQLVAGQNFELQAQVLESLRELGFQVEDMDEVWGEREPREDYWIRDPEQPDWFVIGDATGTTKGVKGTKLMTVERYVTKYVNENPGGPIPPYWLIANHFAERAPGARPADLVRGDELGVVEASNSLVLDTVALFKLVMAVRRQSASASSVRSMLRACTGQFTANDAALWIEVNSIAERAGS